MINLHRRQKWRSKVVLGNLQFLQNSQNGPVYVVQSSITINGKPRGYIRMECSLHTGSLQPVSQGNTWEVSCIYFLEGRSEFITPAFSVSLIYWPSNKIHPPTDISNIAENYKPDIYKIYLLHKRKTVFNIIKYNDWFSEIWKNINFDRIEKNYPEVNEPFFKHKIFYEIQKGKCNKCGKILSSVNFGRLAKIVRGAEFSEDYHMWEVLCKTCHIQKIQNLSSSNFRFVITIIISAVAGALAFDPIRAWIKGIWAMINPF